MTDSTPDVPSSDAEGSSGKSSLIRRDFLVAATASGIALASPFGGLTNAGAQARGKRRPFAREGAFAHGVSSGMPTSHSIVLWTRLTEIGRSSRLTLEVSTDKHFKHVVERRTVLADARKDYAVHARVQGLKPQREYYYRFETKQKHSRVGRFRTLPPSNSKQPIKIGFYSCQSYEAGYFNAQAGLAREDDLDLVLCLGDYIYETHFWDGPADRVDTTGINHDGEVETLAEYREKYRFYQSDKNLQDMHAAYPFVPVWDDHEVEDDYNKDGTSSKQKDPTKDNTDHVRRVPFANRERNGYRAFFESLPRIQDPREPDRIYGSIRMGGLAELFLTDQRQYRDPQPCDDTFLNACAEEGQPGRTLLGAKQKAWFKKAVPASTAKWKIWGSQVMVMALDLPLGKHANPDQWDGYSAERQEILDHFLAKGVKNLGILSGDIHTIFVGNLTNTGEITGTPVGVEFGGGSATSFGIPETLGFSPELLATLAPANDPHIVFSDFTHRGYGVATVREKDLTFDIKGLSGLVKGDKPVTLAKYRAQAGTPKLEKI